jgi:hypothetical protein
MVVDNIGNELKKDDWVAVSRGDQVLVGIVMSVDSPSMIAPATKNAMAMPGMVKIVLLPIVEIFNAQNPRLGNVIKVTKPPNADKVMS